MSQPQTSQQTTSPAPAPQGRDESAPAERGGSQRGGRGGRGRGSRGRGGPTNPPIQQQSPVVIPAPGNQQARNPNPTPNSAAPTFTGWGTPNVQLERRQVRREFTTSAAPYVDLVYAEYDMLVAQHAREGSRVPRSLFVYLCGLAWWYRVLHLKMHNYRLTPQEREAYRTIDMLEFNLPDRISQYLKGMGNFVTNGERFEALWGDFDFTANAGQANPLGLGGFYNTPAGRRVNLNTMWLYAHALVPGVLMGAILNEFMRQTGAPANVRQNLDGISPVLANIPGADAVTRSRNILVYEPTSITQLHSSWEDTFFRLGYRNATAANLLAPPNGTVSHWLIHADTIRYTSDVLYAIGGYKMSSAREINKQLSGAYFQVAYLEQPEYLIDEIVNPHQRVEFKMTEDSNTVLSSFNGISPAHLGPALGCGYRYWIRFGTIQNVNGVSVSAPWFYTQNNVLMTLPIASRVAANEWFLRLPTEYAARVYQTGHVQRRTLLHNILQ